MPKITETTTFEGTAIINIEYEDGSTWSGLKSAYDQMLAQAEQSTPIVTPVLEETAPVEEAPIEEAPVEEIPVEEETI